jgi:hypothetical protein
LALNPGEDETLEDQGKDGKIKSTLSLNEQDLFTFTRKKFFTKEDRMGM